MRGCNCDLGATVAKYAGLNVYRRLAQEPAYIEGNYREALKRAFLGTDEDILKGELQSSALDT